LLIHPSHGLQQTPNTRLQKYHKLIRIKVFY